MEIAEIETHCVRCLPVFRKWKRGKRELRAAAMGIAVARRRTREEAMIDNQWMAHLRWHGFISPPKRKRTKKAVSLDQLFLF